VTETETLQMIRDYIWSAEHEDSWGVPCVYTDRLRQIVGMPESPLTWGKPRGGKL
jgi:hypothetical protein